MCICRFDALYIDNMVQHGIPVVGVYRSIRSSFDQNSPEFGPGEDILGTGAVRK